MTVSTPPRDTGKEPGENEEAELARLVHFLRGGGEQFGLAVATYRNETRRGTVITRSITAAAPLQVARLDALREPAGNIAQAWQTALTNEQAGGTAHALHVTGLEPSLLESDGRPKEPTTPEISLLNQQRDQLPGLIHARVVLWLRPEAARALALSARDLNEVVLTRFDFETQTPKPDASPLAVNEADENAYVDPETTSSHAALPPEIVRAEIAALDAAYARHPEGRPGHETALRLAESWLRQRDLTKAQLWLDRAKAWPDVVGDQSARGAVLRAQALIHAERGDRPPP